jgi:hypothetical protein
VIIKLDFCPLSKQATAVKGTFQKVYHLHQSTPITLELLGPGSTFLDEEATPLNAVEINAAGLP